MPVVWEKYRHYKSTGWSGYTYEIIDIAKHTETWEILVVYKPLYVIDELWLFNVFARPLSMREEEVVYNGNVVKRFMKIE
jgi:hypothetical protein